MKTNVVLHGEAIHHLRRFEDRSLGMVVSDPPFFIGIGRDDGGVGADPWTDIASVEAAAAWGEPLMHEFRRTIRKGGAVVLMCGVHASAAWMLAAERAGLVWMAELEVLWNEGKPRARNFGGLHTHIQWFITPGARHVWTSQRRAIYSNILLCKKVPRNQRMHPAQKPVELTTFLISLLSKHDDIILDPFCGSGSSLVSAAICDRQFVGIDRDDKYVKIAKRRAMHYETEDEGELFLWCNGRMEAV